MLDIYSRGTSHDRPAPGSDRYIPFDAPEPAPFARAGCGCGCSNCTGPGCGCCSNC